MTPRRTHPALHGRPLGFAHRGFTPVDAQPPSPRPATAEGGHPWENTLAAFEAALALGLGHLETDVQATRDGVAVVLHDPDLRRTTGRPVQVSTITWAELTELRVGGVHPVPRIEEALEAFPDAVLNIDCKDGRAVRPLAEALRAAGAQDRVVVASFDGRRARAVQDLVPGVGRSLGIAGTAGARLAAGLDRISHAAGLHLLSRICAGADALQVPERAGRLTVVTERLVELAHEAGLQVHVWTVDDPDDMTRLLDLGVDGIMSDRADLLSEVLHRRAG